MSKRTIRLQPSSGKFLQTSLDGRIINIFLVDPKTNVQGTEVNYDDAIRILAFKNPVAIPVPVKGKTESTLSSLQTKTLRQSKTSKITVTKRQPLSYHLTIPHLRLLLLHRMK